MHRWLQAIETRMRNFVLKSDILTKICLNVIDSYHKALENIPWAMKFGEHFYCTTFKVYHRGAPNGLYHYVRGEKAVIFEMRMNPFLPVEEMKYWVPIFKVKRGYTIRDDSRLPYLQGTIPKPGERLLVKKRRSARCFAPSSEERCTEIWKYLDI